MACFNALLKKDEAIESSTSSGGIEEAFAGLTQSLNESRQKYEEDKVSWESKLKSSELALHEAEQSSKKISTKLEEAERCKVALEEKLRTAEELGNKLKEAERRIGELEKKVKSTEELDVKPKDAEQRKGDLEEKLKSSEELLRKEISSRSARKKKYFSAGWDKGWNKALTALSSQMEYARLKFFKDGWNSALQRLNVAKTSELFQEHSHGPPPTVSEEEEDEIPSDESSFMVTEQVPDTDVPQSSEQLPQTTIPAEQREVSSEQSSTSSRADDIVGNKKKV